MRRHRRALAFWLTWFAFPALSWVLVIAVGYGLTALAVHLVGR